VQDLSHKKGSLEKSDEHYTPKWLFDQMDIRFDLDVAAPKGGSHVPADRYYTQEDDGLAQPWIGSVWMNPPFSKPTPWVDKFITNANGVALLVVSRSMWFRDIWEAADAIVPTPFNFKFERPDGSGKGISFQTFLFAFGEQNVAGLNRLERRVR
jgi:phage N-6-adenine-methyltransferase